MTTTAITPDVKSSGDLDLAPRLGNLLEEYSEIATILPVLAGLLVTSRLQLRGAQALLVNLAIAAVARQAVIHLKQQAHPPTTVAAVVESGQAASADPSPVVEDYTIVHSTWGRLRLRIPRLISDAVYARRLEKILSSDEQIVRLRMNRPAASLVIQYDAAGVSELEIGTRLLQILEQAEQDSQVDPSYPTAESQ
jgi:hypothetical protein